MITIICIFVHHALLGLASGFGDVMCVKLGTFVKKFFRVDY